MVALMKYSKRGIESRKNMEKEKLMESILKKCYGWTFQSDDLIKADLVEKVEEK